MNKLNKKDLLRLQAKAVTAAKEAGGYIQSQFDNHYITRQKVGGDSLASQVVTEVDLKAQEIILQHLQSTLSDYDLGLLSEEFADDHSRIQKDYFWCIDPMDGTLPFTERRTGYAVSIALISKDGNPLIGVVYIPDLEDCYSAIKGNGLFVNEHQLIRAQVQEDEKLHFYMDRSFQSEVYYEEVKTLLSQWSEKHHDKKLTVHADFGGVRNAIGVFLSASGCYFKYPKKRKGCGSIWDYAATRLFFEELKLSVSNASGEDLHLNNTENTFMNEVGILYCTETEISQIIMKIGHSILKRGS